MIGDFRRLIAPFQRRIALMIGRGIIRLVDDARQIQELQLDLNGQLPQDGMERFQQYGFTSVPFPGAEAVMVSVAGDRNNGIIIAVDDRRYRLKGLQSGEVALYDDLGQKAHLTRTGINVESPLNVTAKAGQKLRLEGDVVEIVAHTTLRHDVHGYADELTFTGGTAWSQDTWQTGAVITATAHPVDPPEHFV